MSKTTRSPNVESALKVLREGKAESVAAAARAAGCDYSHLKALWRAEAGEIAKPKPSRVAQALEHPSEAEETAQERELARRLIEAKNRSAASQAEARAAKRTLKEVEAEADQLRNTLALLQDVETIGRPDWLEVPKTPGKRRASLIAAFSDYHFGEVVNPAEMAWYNSYNLSIGEKRIRRFFQRTILMSRAYLTGVDYDGIVMPSLGDIISGDIHDEFVQTNEVSSYETLPIIIPWLAEGIGEFADEFGKVHVPCVPGNHPRDSRKPRYKRRSAHNADTLIAWLLAKEFENDDRVTFDIPEGISADFQVYDTRFRIEHGDEASGGGGIQGAMLPIALLTHKRRKQAQAEGTPFDILMIGHWHQLMSMPAKGFIVNGTGKGYDEYARGKGFEPEAPQQALIVVTPEHGISLEAPLFVSNREDEGW